MRKPSGRKRIPRAVSVAGQAPHLGERVIDDPFERGAKITAIVNLRESPVELLRSRGVIDESQYIAACWFRDRYERSSIGALQSVDHTKVRVDGGYMTSGVSDVQQKAMREIGLVFKFCGKRSYELLVNVVGLRTPIAHEATTRARARGCSEGNARSYIIGRLGEALDDLCDHLGIGRVAVGPSRGRITASRI